MMRKRWTRNGLLLAAIFAIFVIGLLPATGWIVRQQFRAMVGMPLFTLPELPEARRDTILAAHPDDFDLQFAGALDQGQRAAKAARKAIEDEASESFEYHEEDARHIARRLIALPVRFGNRPVLHAHILRFLCQNAVYPQREEEDLISRYTGPNIEKKPQTLSAGDLTTFLRSAARGEELDPENAYFPAMAAVGCFAAKRDREAFDALARAASRPNYDDYTSEEAQASWKLQEAAGDKTAAMSRYIFSLQTIYPHYARLRATARIAIGLAVQAEREGRTADGLAIRRNVARLGARIRIGSPGIVGELVGKQISATVVKRPGGIPLPPEPDLGLGPMGGPELMRDSPPSLSGDIPIGTPPSFSTPDAPKPKSSEERERDERLAYLAYLRRIGAADEAAWYASEYERGRTLRNPGIDSQYEAVEWEAMGLARLWGIGIFLLLNTFWILLLGGVAKLFTCARRVREGQPLRSEVRWGVTYTAIYPCLAYAVVWLVEDAVKMYFGPIFYAGVVIVLCIGLLPFFILKRGTDWRGYAGLLGRFCLTLLFIAATLFAVFQSLFGVARAVYSEGGCGDLLMFFRMAIIPPDESIIWVPTALPLLVLFVLTIWSRVRHVPVSVGIARGLRRVSVPLAAVMLFAYAATVCLTAREEARVSAIVERLVEKG